MEYVALACDYDGTLAHDGKVDEDTLGNLERFSNLGGQLILITGRQLDELKEVFPELLLFQKVVAENGALLYNPVTKEEKLLCDRPSQEFITRLQQKGVTPLSVGRAIVATWQPHYET
ncbi:MAG: HAD family hydrolase, partial [Chroococcales cyanobacterium]